MPGGGEALRGAPPDTRCPDIPADRGGEGESRTLVSLLDFQSHLKHLGPQLKATSRPATAEPHYTELKRSGSGDRVHPTVQSWHRNDAHSVISKGRACGEALGKQGPWWGGNLNSPALARPWPGRILQENGTFCHCSQFPGVPSPRSSCPPLPEPLIQKDKKTLPRAGTPHQFLMPHRPFSSQAWRLVTTCLTAYRP